jgi:phosphatidylserine decarboxylase
MTSTHDIHQYIDRETAQIVTERLYQDRAINFLYSHAREKARVVFNALVSSRSSGLLGFFNYDLPHVLGMKHSQKIIRELGINLAECVDRPEQLDTPRKIFERKIKYSENRPMPNDPDAIVAPADSKVLVGSFEAESQLFLKEKFFDFEELLGPEKIQWLRAFASGSYAVFRLTPEKYHYNHVPVSGKVVDIYEIGGKYHSCNPGAAITEVTPYSKNKRVITIIDTDVQEGTRVGLVAMIEIVALMIGEILQCYSAISYDHPQKVYAGLFLKKGQPKSLYRPGSSVDVLIFQKDKVKFCEDIVANMRNTLATTRFSKVFCKPVVETDVKVRSRIATRISDRLYHRDERDDSWSARI